MDPQSTVSQNNIEPASVSPPPKRKFSKRWIIIAALVVLLGLLFIVFRQSGNKPASDSSNSSNELYITRDGYDQQEYGTGIGDPSAIVMKPGSSDPVTYRDAKVIQACNVLTITEIRDDLGLKTRAHQLQGFKRSYFDGQGKGVLEASLSFLPRNPDSNHCQYLLEGDAVIGLEVYQPPYTTVEALSREVIKYKKQPPIGELNVYLKVGENSENAYIVGRGAQAVEVRLSNVADESAVLRKVAANFVRERANPAGPPIVTMESPLLEESPYDACKLLPASTVKRLFGAELSPFVEQTYGNSVGVLSVDTEAGKISGNYVQNECSRQVVKNDADIQAFTTRRARLSVTTNDSLELAKSSFAFGKSHTQNAKGVGAVGDEAYFVVGVLGPELHMRSGTVEFVVGFKDERAGLSAQQTIERLRELASTALQRM